MIKAGASVLSVLTMKYLDFERPFLLVPKLAELRARSARLLGNSSSKNR
jgi:hypothetical protein